MVWDKGGKKQIVFCLGMLCARLRYILKHVQRGLKQVIYFYLFDFFFRVICACHVVFSTVTEDSCQ